MKLFKRAFALLLAAAAVAGGMTACDDGPEDTPSSFDITVEQSSDYEIEAPSSAAPLDDVEFTVTVKNPDKYVAGATCNGEDCFGSDGEYSFIMPTEDVVLKAVLADYEEVLSDGALSMGADVNRTVVINSSYPDSYPNNLWKLRIATNWNDTDISQRSYIDIIDETVIPSSAITFDKIDGFDIFGSTGSNRIYYVDICIDTTQISVGETWIQVYLRGNNTSSAGTLTFLVTVVESVELKTMSESVVIDFNGYAAEGDDIVVRFYDGNYIENSTIGGQKAPRYIQVSGKVGADGKMTCSFDYVVGHSYSVDIYKGTEWYEGPITNGSDTAQRVLMLGGDVVGQGSVSTGFDEYVDGELSFVNANSSLELTVMGTFQEINWG